MNPGGRGEICMISTRYLDCSHSCSSYEKEDVVMGYVYICEEKREPKRTLFPRT